MLANTRAGARRAGKAYVSAACRRKHAECVTATTSAPFSDLGGRPQPAQRGEMVRFFREELQTPAWMRALSTRDIDVTFSTRPDHQWTGAYAAWPALAVGALYGAGAGDVAFAWMRGLAQTATQGPIAQAHFAESVFAPEAGGGAQKAPRISHTSTMGARLGLRVSGDDRRSLFGVRGGLSASSRPRRSSACSPRASCEGSIPGKRHVASSSASGPRERARGGGIRGKAMR